MNPKNSPAAASRFSIKLSVLLLIFFFLGLAALGVLFLTGSNQTPLIYEPF